MSDIFAHTLLSFQLVRLNLQFLSFGAPDARAYGSSGELLVRDIGMSHSKGFQIVNKACNLHVWATQHRVYR